MAIFIALLKQEVNIGKKAESKNFNLFTGDPREMTAPRDSCAIIIFLLSLRTTGINLTDSVIIMEISEILTPNFLRGLKKNSATYGISLADIELIIINDIMQNIDILENIMNEFLIESSVMLMNPILNNEFPLE